MKYIKKFELVTNNRLKPKINDFVICREPFVADELKDFLSSNIGQIIDFNKGDDKYYFSSKFKYVVRFNDIPRNVKQYFTDDSLRGYSDNEIIYHSKNKEAVEAYLRK
jgi:hypothetical protein